MKLLYLLLLNIIIVFSCGQTLSAQSKSDSSVMRKTVHKTQPKEKKIKVRFINPTTLAKPFGYSHVVETTNGRMIFISGQVGLDRLGNIISGEDFRGQTEQVFENIKAALEAVGASFKDVVKLNIYVTDISQLQTFRDVRDKYVNTKNPPASSLVEVRKLIRDELLIEIDAIAVLPQ